MKRIIYLVLFSTLLGMMQPAFASTDYAKLRLERQYFNALTANCEDIHTKNPATAAVLGFFPGGGSYYTGEISLGVVDMFTWPFSAFWDAPLSYNRAKFINKTDTVTACKLMLQSKSENNGGNE